jgi:putative ABC transport system permease protein
VQKAMNANAREKKPFSPLILARWQARQTWRLLLVTGMGVIAAVIIVCAVPVYSQIALTAELESALREANSSSDLLVQATAGQIQPQDIQNQQGTLDQLVHSTLGGEIVGSTQFSLVMTDADIFRPSVRGGRLIAPAGTGEQLNLIGQTIAQVAPHLTLLAGTLPSSNGNVVDIDIMPGIAASLGSRLGGTLKIGSRFALQVAFDDDQGKRLDVHYLTLRVAGFFRPKNDPFWHDNAFDCTPLGQQFPPNEMCGALASNAAMIAALDSFDNDPKLAGLHIEAMPTLSWYYHLNIGSINTSNLNQTLQAHDLLSAQIGPSLDDRPFIENTTLTDPIITVISLFQSRQALVEIPLNSLSLLIAALTLFFVALMTGILVDRQADAIAVLRSRGAGRWQIFSAFLLQGAAISLGALLIGPLLAMLVTPLVALRTLPAADTSAIGVITTEPLAIIQEIMLPTLLAVGVALLTMIVSIGGAVRRDMLSLRRESARSTYRPLWQRLHLDVVAAIIAVTGFAFSLYASSPGVLDEQTRELALAPLTLTGTIFLLLGLLLLLLRAFPLILRGASRLAQRNRGATTMLAVVQMERAPRHSLRMTLLLAFSVAFAIFALVFSASQTQRVIDVANYEVGADFSAQISSFTGGITSATYSRLPGVLSAAIGYSSFPIVTENATGQSITAQLLAVDTDTYANTITWTAQDSSEPIAPLMNQLITGHAAASASHILPVILDNLAASTLHLAPGSIFSLSDNNITVNCRVIAVVERIPTINDSAFGGSADSPAITGGILADYQSYAAIVQKATGAPPPPNQVWLKTRGDAASLASVRRAITKPALLLSDVNDRRAIIANLIHDPLYLDLSALLILGSIMALLLALVGNLLASWLSVRGRLTNFAVLRALGTAPRQLASMLTCEQGIIYAGALLLGGVFGILLSILALPSLIFTTIAASSLDFNIGNGQDYILQTTPPVQVIIPASLWIVCAALVALCILAVLMMVRVAARPSMGQMLRLNED